MNVLITGGRVIDPANGVDQIRDLFICDDKIAGFDNPTREITVDKTGAGDAMLAIISLCLKNKLSNELSLLIGSLAAAQSTESIGNKNPVNKIKILKTLENLLK